MKSRHFFSILHLTYTVLGSLLSFRKRKGAPQSSDTASVTNGEPPVMANSPPTSGGPEKAQS